MNSKCAETKSQAESAINEIRCKLEGFTPSKLITILNVLMAEAKRAAPESPPVIQALHAADDEEQRMKSVPLDVLGIATATMLQELVNCKFLMFGGGLLQLVSNFY
jgi:hypothetical protein